MDLRENSPLVYIRKLSMSEQHQRRLLSKWQQMHLRAVRVGLMFIKQREIMGFMPVDSVPLTTAITQPLTVPVAFSFPTFQVFFPPLPRAQQTCFQMEHPPLEPDVISRSIRQARSPIWQTSRSVS